MVRKKKQIKLKEPVRLREKKLKDGNRSLYLDIYSNGIRKYEYLKLYLIPELRKVERKTKKILIFLPRRSNFAIFDGKVTHYRRHIKAIWEH